VSLSSELREYAELPDRYAPIPPRSSVTRFDDGRVCVLQGASWASVTAVSVEEDAVADLVAQVRALVAPEKKTTWWLGPSTRPADLPVRLLAEGLTVPPDGVASVRALALTQEPPQPPSAIDVRTVDTFEDFCDARRCSGTLSRSPRNGGSS
jgi:hypothetical protein